ncbi:TetR/AcrR family transcriptional regulator [Cryptosporangium aurantiacum]|uniref:Transcriptional regulator, TetR family n=1 Tax=Cryptosporangium aurantiacum TaxID=134849 RepID=A0A1M7TTU5_9ACTN|nr:TetR/AcrR family transcriptional regulator [Cryptosporangium aurantiacum]SHN74108.1 transcriptional regulator, TetR family [Cryptosporangium aurantiacum]
MADTKGARTSARLTESMLDLIQRHGYSGTGLNTVVQHAGAPKGSLYFHFPDGKEALGEKAVELAAAQLAALAAEVTPGAATPGAAVRRFIEALAGILVESDYELGCPVSVVTLEMGGQSERLRTACANAFASWIDPLAAHLVAHGRSAPAAHATATAVVSLIEGAVIVSRAQRSTQPLDYAAQAVGILVDGTP